VERTGLRGGGVLCFPDKKSIGWKKRQKKGGGKELFGLWELSDSVFLKVKNANWNRQRKRKK